MFDHNVAKVIEIVGSSPKSFEDAVDIAVATAAKSIKNITGVQVHTMSGSVENGEVTSYRATVKIAFGVEA